MPTVIPFEDPANYDRAMAIVRRLWNEGAVHFEWHAVRRMRRRHIDVNDVERIVQLGRIVGHNRPRPDKGWRYTLAGQTVEGEPVACVVTIEARLIIITVTREEG